MAAKPTKKAAKKPAAKKTTARQTAPAAKPTPEPSESNETTAREAGTALGTVDVPLSTSGEHNGRTKQLRLLQPTPDQLAWADGAFYRVTLALEAAQAGEPFDQRDRGRVFTDVERMAGVFLSAWEADWAKDAVSSGEVQMADMWSAMSDAFERAGGEPLPVGDSADITIDA